MRIFWRNEDEWDREAAAAVLGRVFILLFPCQCPLVFGEHRGGVAEAAEIKCAR